jgi:hypothetical protein
MNPRRAVLALDRGSEVDDSGAEERPENVADNNTG